MFKSSRTSSKPIIIDYYLVIRTITINHSTYTKNLEISRSNFDFHLSPFPQFPPNLL